MVCRILPPTADRVGPEEPGEDHQLLSSPGVPARAATGGPGVPLGAAAALHLRRQPQGGGGGGRGAAGPDGERGGNAAAGPVLRRARTVRPAPSGRITLPVCVCVCVHVVCTDLLKHCT